MARYIILLCALLFAVDSSASFKVCNNNDRTVSVAWGWATGQLSNSQGWVKIGSNGQCKVLFGNITNRYIYVFVAWAGASRIQGDVYAGDGYVFCVNPYQSFKYSDNTNAYGCSGDLVSKNFMEVDVGNYQSFVFTLSPPKRYGSSH